MTNYYLNPAISNSSLSYIDPETGGAPAKFYEYLNGTLNEEKSPSLEKGDYIHKFILTPDEFITITVEMPSPAVKTFVDTVFIKATLGKTADEQRVLNIQDYSKDLLEEAKDWNPKWKPDTKIANIIKSGEAYWNAKREHNDKTILDGEVYETIKKCADSIRRNSAANALLLDSPGQVVFNEQEIYWTEEWGGMKLSFKAKIDRLVVDPKEKTFSIIDFKTTSKFIANFPESFEYYRYYRQISFYEHAVKLWLEQMGYHNFTADDHYIVAVETKGYNLCRVFVVSEPYLRKGRQETANLLNRIVYHFSTGDWVNPKEEQETVNKTYILIPSEYV